jgi:hypothetical protein
MSMIRAIQLHPRGVLRNGLEPSTLTVLDMLHEDPGAFDQSRRATSLGWIDCR